MASKSSARRRTQRQIDAQVRRAFVKADRQKKGGATAVTITEAAGYRLSARQLAWRYRYQLAPVAVIGGLYVAAYLVRNAHNVAGAIALYGVLLAAGAWFFTRRWLDRMIERVYAAVILAASALWLAWAVSHPAQTIEWKVAGDLSLWLPGPLAKWPTRVLAFGGVGLALPWWRHFRIRPGERPSPLTDLQAVWDTYVSPDGAILPKSRLVGELGIPNGKTATIVLDRGKQTTDNAVAATGRITSAFDLSIGSVVVEPTDDGSAAKAKLTVLAHNPLRSTITWPGPEATFDPSSGIARIGLYADGAPTEYIFWVPGFGPWHDLISGTTGSGKSRLLDQLLAVERHSPLMVSWVNDTQGGQSLPDWQDNVDWFTRSPEEGLVMLRSVRDVMLDRSSRLAKRAWVDAQGRERKGVPGFTPTPEEPLLVVTLEESSPLLAIEEAKDIAADIGKRARKTGIKLRIVNHVPLVTEMGGSATLREMVASGNVIVFRTATAVTGNVAFQGSLPVQPNTLPRRNSAGLGFTMGAQARPAAMRTYFVEDPFGYALSGSPGALELEATAAAGEAYLWRNDPDAPIGVPNNDLADHQPSKAPEAADRVLALLRERGQPMAPAEITKALGAARTTVTSAIEKLERRGLIHRGEDATVKIIER